MDANLNAARRQVSDVVAERIERLIVDGVLKVGQPLPSERRLCEKLGISRSALREGLKVLRGRGIIETAQGRDSRVAKLSGERDASPLMHLFNSQPRTLYDLLEVRGLLEGESARLAALRGTEADFVLLTRRYEEMLAAHTQENPVDPREHARLDHAFAGQQSSRDRDREPVVGEPFEAVDRGIPAVRAALSLVNRLGMMIEAHTDRQLRTVSLLQGEQFLLMLPHRLHRVR